MRSEFVRKRNAIFGGGVCETEMRRRLLEETAARWKSFRSSSSSAGERMSRREEERKKRKERSERERKRERE